MLIEDLRNLPPFSGLDDDTLAKIKTVSTLCEYEMGQPIINNLIPDDVYLLIKGEIRHLVDLSDENSSFTLKKH